jgi:DNA-binding NarL/FixJ family response regulator
MGLVRVAVVSPQEIVGTGVCVLLRRAPEQIELVRPPDGPEEPDPDVVLFDALALLGGQDDQLRYLVERTFSRVLVIARDLRPDLGAHALRVGADGFVSLGASGPELVEAVVRAATGDDRGAARRAREPGNVAGEGYGAKWAELAGVSPREVQVLSLVAAGRSNLEIAAQLHLSVNSVKTYVRTSYRKIDVATRAQAVHWAFTNGLTPDKTT